MDQVLLNIHLVIFYIYQNHIIFQLLLIFDVVLHHLLLEVNVMKMVYQHIQNNYIIIINTMN